LTVSVSFKFLPSTHSKSQDFSLTDVPRNIQIVTLKKLLRDQNSTLPLDFELKSYNENGSESKLESLANSISFTKSAVHFDESSKKFHVWIGYPEEKTQEHAIGANMSLSLQRSLSTSISETKQGLALKQSHDSLQLTYREAGSHPVIQGEPMIT
jgi:hypothetical protein